MSTSEHEDGGIRSPQDDPRLTAYVLGELSEAEIAEVESMLEDSAELRAFVDGLRVTAAQLEQELAAEESIGLTQSQRSAIEDAARSAGSNESGTVETETPVHQLRTNGLSPDAESDAKKGSGSFMRNRDWMTLAGAAAVLLVAGNLAMTSGWFGGADERTANSRGEASVRRAASDELMSLGYSGDGSSSGSDVAPSASQNRVLPTEKSVGYGSLEALGYAGGETSSGETAPSEKPKSRVTTRNLRDMDALSSKALGYSGPSSPGPSGPSSPGARAPQRQVAGSPAPGGGGGGLGRSGMPMSERAPAESLSREDYAHQAENDFKTAKDEPLSTFSVDVDTASYSNLRRMLREGKTPPHGAVRIEEMLNYFPYTDAPPVPNSEVPFSVHTELFTAPWATQNQLLRVALATQALPLTDRKPSNLVFLLDVSGSMNNDAKLPLLKKALRMMVRELDQRDRIAIVVYAGAAGLVLDSTSCDSPHTVLDAIDRLRAGGSTNGVAGIQLAYQVAQRNFIDGGTNRVLLATDGDFNVGTSDTSSLVEMAKKRARSGVFLTVLGFGSGNLQDSKMESIANQGNGHYAYIDSVLEARKVLVDELGATLEVVAKDVKIQVEFNPAEIESYRLIGYENRLLAARDFADDSKDAGEIGAGHHVTVLYELVRAKGAAAKEELPLRYQQERQPTGAAFSGETATVKLRWKAPNAKHSKLAEKVVHSTNKSFDEAGIDARFGVAVASFGMLLRNSAHVSGLDYGTVRSWAQAAMGDDVGGYRHEFVALVDLAISLFAPESGDAEAGR
ncbi:MAG: Ca-activated chloride channel family protein [Planctomycetota bacterium]|jgi:Ca-activated chloride channel family protein